MSDSSSRFKFTDLVTQDGHETYGRWVEPRFISASTWGTLYVTSSFAGRPDRISDAVYDTTAGQYWWAIVAFNAPLNPLNWPQAGEIIKIPRLTDILKEM
jgi:hypothetical protein